MANTWMNLIFILTFSLASSLLGDATEVTLDGVVVVASDAPMEEMNNDEVIVDDKRDVVIVDDKGVVHTDEDNHDFPNSEPEVHIMTRSLNCELKVINNQIYYWSPNFGQENYPNNKVCGLYGHSGPNRAIFKIKPLKLQDKVNGTCVDYYYFTYPYSIVKKHCGHKNKKTVKLPYYNYISGFKSDSTINDKGFNMSVSVKGSICHQTFTLSSIGDFGEVATPNNPNKDTKSKRMCEFHIRSPTNTTVQLDFLNFNLQGSCTKSSLVINLEGDKRYPMATSSRYCGTNTPPTMTSLENEAFLIYQSKPKSKGFRVRYTAMP